MNHFPTKRQRSRPGEPLTRDWAIPGQDWPISVRSYTPSTQHRLPLVLYFHGGGFTGGSIDDAHVPARYLAAHCPAIVVCVAYSLAPARPFPAAPEDAYSALEWASRHAADIGGHTRRLAVAGHDAGGNLAACLALIARDRHAGPIAAQVLIGPMLDPSMTRWAAVAGADATARHCAACYGQYLPRAVHRLHPYAAPLESRRLKSLPPALIVTSAGDALHTEAEHYAASLIEAGVPTQVVRFGGISRASLPAHLPALSEIADFLRRRLWAGRAFPFFRNPPRIHHADIK